MNLNSLPRRKGTCQNGASSFTSLQRPATQARIRGALRALVFTNPETWSAGSATTWAHLVTDDVQTRQLRSGPRTALTSAKTLTKKNGRAGARTDPCRQCASGAGLDCARRWSRRDSDPALVRIHRARGGSGDRPPGWQDGVHPTIYAGARALAQRAERQGSPLRSKRDCGVTTGSMADFHFSVSPIADDSGRIVKWYGINTDIDDRVRSRRCRAPRPGGPSRRSWTDCQQSLRCSPPTSGI